MAINGYVINGYVMIYFHMTVGSDADLTVATELIPFQRQGMAYYVTEQYERRFHVLRDSVDQMILQFRPLRSMTLHLICAVYDFKTI